MLGTHKSMDGALHSAGLGNLYLNMKDFGMAIKHFTEAMDIHKELGSLDKPEGIKVVEAVIGCQRVIEFTTSSKNLGSSCCI